MATYKTEPQARVLADSVSPEGYRLTTMEVTMHRFVLAEFNTHRVFSRNSASSRAIPGRLHRERVQQSPAIPLAWPAKQSGMQGGEPLSLLKQQQASATWQEASMAAVEYARELDELGVHKSVTNRLLEPFLWHTVLVTSTEWDNFFQQRDSKQAQPEIAEPARLMRKAYVDSDPREVGRDEWHLPLLQHEDLIPIGNYTQRQGATYEDFKANMRKVSVARCARVSYLNHDGERSIQDDLDLYKKLETYGHWSPFEHVATPCECGYEAFYGSNPNPIHKGNFTGWDQLRHLEA